jgi:hypothetical protein
MPTIDTKLDRFLAKNQHTQRKLLYLANRQYQAVKHWASFYKKKISKNVNNNFLLTQ